MNGRVVEVVKVLDQWFGTYYRYCKVKGADCALYVTEHALKGLKRWTFSEDDILVLPRTFSELPERNRARCSCQTDGAHGREL
jgi:hypothetical protein